MTSARFTTRAALSACMAAASVIAPGRAPAQQDAPAAAERGPDVLEALIADLSSPDFETRQRASDRLALDPAVTFADIERVLKTRHLPLEAHARLLTAARDRFRFSPRGAMGVGFNLRFLQSRIVIDRTYAPFPCHRILQPGDLIVEADGVRLHGPTAQPTIQGLIVARDPGSVMKLVVRRGAEKLELDVPLGRFADLENSNLDELRLARAWRTRSREYLAPEGDPIVPPLHPAAWPGPNVSAQMRQAELIRVRMQQQAVPMQVTAGGESGDARYIGDSKSYAAQVRFFNGQRLNQLGGNAQAAQMLIDFDNANPGATPLPADDLRTIDNEMMQLLNSLDRARADAARARPGSAEARMAAERAENLEHQQRVLTRLREAILAEQAEAEGEAERRSGAAATVPGQD